MLDGTSVNSTVQDVTVLEGTGVRVRVEVATGTTVCVGLWIGVDVAGGVKVIDGAGEAVEGMVRVAVVVSVGILVAVIDGPGVPQGSLPPYRSASVRYAPAGPL